MLWASTLALCLACGLITATTSENGSNDVSFQELRTLVQQQGTVIEQLETTLTALHNQMRELTSQFSQQTNAISNLTQRMNTQVTFTARMSDVLVKVGFSPFLFNHVVTNVGGGYNPDTGIFTAPVAGLYMFYAQVMNHATAERMDWGIFISSSHRMLCLNGMDAPSTVYDKASCLATTRLDSGQQVLVRRTSVTGTLIEGNAYTSFSGLLLSVDQ